MGTTQLGETDRGRNSFTRVWSSGRGECRAIGHSYLGKLSIRQEIYLVTAYNIERPITLTTSRFTQPVTKGDLLNIPSRRLDLDHIDVNDSLPLIPNSLPAFVECPAFGAFESSLACVKTGRCWIGGGTSKQEGIGLDGTVDGSLVSVNVDLPVSRKVL